MKQPGLHKFSESIRGDNVERVRLSSFSFFSLLSAAAICIGLTGCEKKPDEPQASELLMSTVWDNTESCGTLSEEPGLYTGIFFPDGRFRTYYKVFETGSFSWSLVGESILYLDNIQSTITELTGDWLTMKAPGTLWGIPITCYYRYRSLPATNITSVGVSGLSRTSATLYGYLRTCDDAFVSAEYGTSTAYGVQVFHAGNPLHKGLNLMRP
jgi:hypothetical protein